MQAIWNTKFFNTRISQKEHTATDKYNTRVTIAKEVSRTVQSISDRMARELTKEILDSIRAPKDGKR